MFFLVGCSTAPSGRSQLLLLPEERVETMSAKLFERTKRRYLIDDDVSENAYVQCVVKALGSVLKEQNGWDVVIFKNEEVNAFALPGGKIGINSGLLRAALNADQLAIVLGHEIGHVIAQHGRERMSQQFSLDAFTYTASVLSFNSRAVTSSAEALAGVVQLGLLYPFSQTQESEADLIGLQLAAKAGFDPRQAIDFWHNMHTLGAVPEAASLSSHPPIEKRLETLQLHMDDMIALQPMKEKPQCIK